MPAPALEAFGALEKARRLTCVPVEQVQEEEKVAVKSVPAASSMGGRYSMAGKQFPAAGAPQDVLALGWKLPGDTKQYPPFAPGRTPLLSKDHVSPLVQKVKEEKGAPALPLCAPASTPWVRLAAQVRPG